MSLDRLLSDALTERVGPLPTKVGEWKTIHDLGRRRRRRRHMGAGFAAALAAIALAVVGVRILSGGTDSGGTVAATPAQSGPSEVLIATGDRVDIVSREDGHVIENVARAPDGLRVISVSAASDGQTVYYAVGAQCEPEHEIWRVSLGDGTPERLISGGSYGIVSPNGQYLAYAAVSPPAQGGCVQYDEVVVRDLTSDEEHRLTTHSAWVVPAAWSLDSRELVIMRGAAVETLRITQDGLRELGTVDVLGNGYRFLPTGEAVAAFPTANASHVATFDPVTGERGRTVAEVSAPLFLADVDGSGGFFLMLGPLSDSTEGWDLYRVDSDAPEPIRLASNVQAATWLPHPAASEEP